MRPVNAYEAHTWTDFAVAVAVAGVGAVSPTVIAGIGDITGSLGGLYWLPVGIVAAHLGALLNTWGLLVEIKR